MGIILVLLPLYAIGYAIMFFKDRWDMFYIKRKEMRSTPEREYLRNEILELQTEMDSMRSKTNPDVSIIKEIQKELDCKKSRLSSLDINPMY